MQEDYLYDVAATYRISLDDLGAFTTFNCTVSLPAANISQSTTYQYKKSGNLIFPAVRVIVMAIISKTHCTRRQYFNVVEFDANPESEL